MTDPTRGADATVSEVTLPARERWLLLGGGALLGLAVGAALPLLAGHLAGLPFVPARDLVAWLGATADGRPWVPLVTALLGGTAGALLGAEGVRRATGVRVSARDIVIVVDGGTRRFARSQVAEAVCEGRVLVLRDAADVDVLRQRLDVAPERVSVALREHGWPLGTS